MAKLSINKNPEKKEFDGGPSRTELIEKIKTLENSASVAELDISLIKTGEPFVSLFPVNEVILEQITDSIKSDGFDRSQPIRIWTERGLVIDGHTRLQAALNAEIKKIPVDYCSFAAEEDALAYAYGLQFRRRNLSDSDRLMFLIRFSNKVVEKSEGDENRGKGRPKNTLNREMVSTLMSVSLGTAQKYVNIVLSGKEQLIEQVLNGTISVNKANGILLKENCSSEEETKRNQGNKWRAKKFASIAAEIVREIKSDDSKYTCEGAIKKLLQKLSESELISQNTYKKILDVVECD